MLEPAGAHTSNNSSVDGAVVVVVAVGKEAAGSSWNNAVSVPVGVVGEDTSFSLAEEEPSGHPMY
jgi:hypothetical protein